MRSRTSSSAGCRRASARSSCSAGNITGYEQLRDLIAEIRSYSPDVLIGVDEETGDVTRIEHTVGSSYPGALALGTVDDVDLTRRVAESAADMIAETGANVNFAPCVDVNLNPLNPVIGSRSFGDDPHLVARHGIAFCEGMQSRRVAATVKHFPGHGDTAVDSHYDLPVVHHDRGQLEEIDLVPFRACIDAGVHVVMTTHVVYPVLSDLPSTVSRPALTGLLREELGFDGVIATDAMAMRAISAGMGVAAATVASLAAGADLPCVDLSYADTRAVREEVIDAVRDGRLPEERLADAAARVRRLQRWARPAPASTWDPSVGLEAARRALIVDAPVPLAGPAYVVDAGRRMRRGVGVTSHGLLATLAERLPGSDGITLTEPPEKVGAVAAAAITAAAGRPIVVTVREAHRQAWQGELVAALSAGRPDTIVVGTGLPHDHALAPGRYLGALGCGRVNIVAVAEALSGRDVSPERADPGPTG
ncbi:MAG: glycoside hydrolase family 3 protein [Mycobacteriales bacterium]